MQEQLPRPLGYKVDTLIASSASDSVTNVLGREGLAYLPKALIAKSNLLWSALILSVIPNDAPFFF